MDNINVARNKINIKKLVVFLYNNNEKSDNENFKITFTLASKPKYLEIRDVHTENYNY